MTLKNWLDNGWLIEHATNSQEISDLLQVADRDLKDCETPWPQRRLAIGD